MMSDQDEWHQKVIGIALVVEEVGKASKLVFRYPSSPEQKLDIGGSSSIDTSVHGRDGALSSAKDGVNVIGNNDSNSGGTTKKNIFFTLPPEVMAKLFRTKQALCKQPMTLSIDSTILCCRSVLLNQSCNNNNTSSSGAAAPDDSSLEDSISAQSQSTRTNTNTSTTPDGLVLFSIIIAVLPSKKDSKTKPRYRSVNAIDDESEQCFNASLNFPVVRRIHLSLSRLCAVLEREERRCMYMSRQVSMLLKIGSLTSHMNNGNENKSNSDEGNFSSREAELVDMMIAAKPPPRPVIDDKVDDEYIRRNMRKFIPLKGNLAMELAQFYHSCARNDTACRTSPASLLSGRNGILYINHHIAINVEPASGRASTFAQNFHLDDIQDNGDIPLLREYHTLLFPHVSAKELLRNISSTSSLDTSSSDRMQGDSSQRRIQKLLTVCNPLKSLGDMSIESALPLTAITEAAMLLIESGGCVAAPVIKESTVFACRHDSIQLMSKFKLEFAQQFSHNIPMFVVVSALTKPRLLQYQNEGDKDDIDNSNGNSSKEKYVTFGEVIEYCKMAVRSHVKKMLSSDDEDKELITEGRENIPTVYRVLAKHIVSMLNQVASVNLEESFTDDNNPQVQEKDIDWNVVNPQNAESILIAMTTWLRSHSIIVELKEYFVSISTPSSGDQVGDTNFSGGSIPNAAKFDKIMKTSGRKSPYDYAYCVSPSLFEEFDDLLSLKFLNGKISSTAFQWKTGMSDARLKALREYGIREKKIQVVTRIPCDGDDWGAP